MRDFVICLTATIEPNTNMVNRSDAELRLDDYKKCIEFYLVETTCPIIFAENSDYDLSGDADFIRFLVDPRFSVQRFKAHPDTSKGKGFQEFYMLDQVVGQLPETAALVKITGRYRVCNISSLLARMESEFSIDLHRKMQVAITGFFAVRVPVYRKYLTGIFEEANDPEGRFIEHVVYDKIVQSDLINSCALLPENAQYEGVSGSHGATMARNKYKMMARSLERTINRSLGIRKFLIEY